MEILAFILIWPFLILAAGLVFIAAGDVVLGWSGLDAGWLWLLVIGLFLWLFLRPHKPAAQPSVIDQLEELKRFIVTSSIALLFPILTRYLVSGYSNSITVIIIALLLSFGSIAVGMFMKDHKVLNYSTIFGGAMALVYLYAQLWELGEGARIIAAAFGLVMAVGLSIAKLKDRLV